MTDIIERLEKHLAEVKALHREALTILADVGDVIKDQSTSLPDMVDIGYLCRDAERHYNELRKDAKAHQELAGKIIAYRRIRDTMNETNPDLKVRGRLATGSPDMASRAQIPKKGTPEYEALCRHFGVADVAIDGALFQPHYVRLADYVQLIQEAGGQLPPGVKLGQPFYSTVFRKR